MRKPTRKPIRERLATLVLEKGQEVPRIQKTKTLLDIDVRRVLEAVEERYGLRLPRRVVAVDFGCDVGDLFVRFRLAEHTEGEPTDDGNVIVHYDARRRIVAVEIADMTRL